MPTILVVGARGIPDCEGGAEKNAERLFPLIAAQGLRVVLMGLRRNIHQAEYRGVELVGAPESRIFKTDKLLYYFSAVLAAVRLRPDIVHLQGLGSAIMLWAYKLLGIRTVVRYGSADYILDKWGFLGKLGFLAAEYQLRFADAVIAVAPSLADRLRERGIVGNVHVIANALDDRADFTEDDAVRLPSEPFILAVGRLTVQKNVDRLIRGFNLMAERVPGVRLLIAGGVDDEAYVDQLKPLLGDRVVLLGKLPRSSLGALYKAATLYVNASVHEGSSNAVLEAISWGCPLQLSGIRENRDFGLPDHFYFDQDDPAAIAKALEAALRRPEHHVADLSRFMTWTAVAEQTRAIYDEAMKHSRPRRAPAMRHA
ncbi:glycosyltransferase family 4 protein [Sphingomonas jatrophae]|uniref:Glycosyltransferase involved in cell wall bisynthesis n=1 Tax=Sphingomonas jatrophae TaxID=1166337 RepID=A0A1I6MC23_9SPHN|nr:glycosyltransferase family 4 protein [Sphingomonas jatrophae]SFS13211.1 Glycosyltransferase involved in cell wall bisynthesis [Sphingomonas jatrophae]